MDTLMGKWCGLLMLCLGFVHNLSYANEEEEAISLFMRTLESCYQEQHTDGVKLAQCVLGAVQKNAGGFRFSMQFSEPNAKDISQFTLTITNPKGIVITCTGRAHHKIEVQGCKGDLTAPRAPAEELKLEPR